MRRLTRWHFHQHWIFCKDKTNKLKGDEFDGIILILILILIFFCEDGLHLFVLDSFGLFFHEYYRSSFLLWNSPKHCVKNCWEFNFVLLTSWATLQMSEAHFSICCRSRWVYCRFFNYGTCRDVAGSYLRAKSQVVRVKRKPG